LYFLPPWLFAAGAVAQGKFIHIDYTNTLAVTKLPREQLDKIGQLKWYFAHASVGANIMDGIADLHQLDPGSCPLRNISASATPPPATQPGAIYDHNRGNPGWKAKFDTFASCVSNGWRFPAVNVALNKLCYIDQTASLRYYLNSMTNLESAYPDTVFVYATMPLMTSEDADNYLRNRFNTHLREWCRTNGRVLFDIADIEAHDAAGAPCEFTYRGKTCQRLCNAYTSDGGHLNPQARQLMARGFYALGAALAARAAETGGK
jgi:lysophospholipase L1-like esterase